MVEAFFDRESSEVSANPSVIRKYNISLTYVQSLKSPTIVVPKALAQRLAGWVWPYSIPSKISSVFGVEWPSHLLRYFFLIKNDMRSAICKLEQPYFQYRWLLSVSYIYDIHLKVPHFNPSGFPILPASFNRWASQTQNETRLPRSKAAQQVYLFFSGLFSQGFQ